MTSNEPNNIKLQLGSSSMEKHFRYKLESLFSVSEILLLKSSMQKHYFLNNYKNLDPFR